MRVVKEFACFCGSWLVDVAGNMGNNVTNNNSDTSKKNRNKNNDDSDNSSNNNSSSPQTCSCSACSQDAYQVDNVKLVRHTGHKVGHRKVEPLGVVAQIIHIFREHCAKQHTTVSVLLLDTAMTATKATSSN